MSTTESSGLVPNDDLPVLLAEAAGDVAGTEGFKEKIFEAISVQHPVVVEYLKSLRRDKPDAEVGEILSELEKRYVATVTITSTGVGASAAIPGVGIPLALGLGAADLLFFYETSALYVLAVTELHGIEVEDLERTRPLVFGMLLGQKSQSQVRKIVMSAAGIDVDDAMESVRGALPGGWGEVLTQQLPDSALSPVATVLAREALKTSAKFGAGTVGKVIPFGLGAVIGGVGSFTFGRDVVNASRLAFPTPPTAFPASLQEFERAEGNLKISSRAAAALDAAKDQASDFGESVWNAAGDVVDVFRPVDLDGDGVPDEARAMTAAKRAGSAVKGTASKGVGAIGAFLKSRQSPKGEEID